MPIIFAFPSALTGTARSNVSCYGTTISYLRNQCEKTFFDERRSSECFICANVPNSSSRFEVRTIFFETNIMSELIAIYLYSFEIFINQIGEMTFCKPKFIIIKANYFRNAPKGECFLYDFETLVREIDVRALMLQNHPKSNRTSARTSISRTTRYAAAKCHFEGSEFKIVICITRPEKTRLRVRVRFAGRGDSRGLQMRVQKVILIIYL
jgi:hypothetical protein